MWFYQLILVMTNGSKGVQTRSNALLCQVSRDSRSFISFLVVVWMHIGYILYVMHMSDSNLKITIADSSGYPQLLL